MNKTSAQGASLSTILLVIFIVLKLTGNIAWSWIWVLAPLWGPIALILGIMTILGICKCFALLVTSLLQTNRRRNDPNNVRTWPWA